MGLLNKFFGPKKDQPDVGSDYGSILMPPSAEADAIRAAMTDEEKINFTALLKDLQKWCDSSSDNGPVRFHPEARVQFWGTALAKMADHYYSINRLDKALFFSSTAYNLSHNPYFAYNVAMLSIETGDIKHAQPLLNTFLAKYRDILTNPIMRIFSPGITAEQLENMATSAREKLIWIKSQLA